MTSVIKAVTWDCEDAVRLASFWAAVLGSDVDEDSTPARAFVEASGWGGPNMWFVRVPEPKSAKNRLHFDLRPVGTLEDEVRRLTDLGATVAERSEDHVVMRDPEGNEFCIEPGMQT
jgi:catechol 2,3-dioxygenase-like lactoylglutathione lyase family enzyme